jgi:hypothetical protein
MKVIRMLMKPQTNLLICLNSGLIQKSVLLYELHSIREIILNKAWHPHRRQAILELLVCALLKHHINAANNLQDFYNFVGRVELLPCKNLPSEHFPAAQENGLDVFASILVDGDHRNFGVTWYWEG